MPRPTPDRVEQEIEKLRKMRPNVRRWTAFGDDNHRAIQVQIEVLESDLDEDDIWGKWGRSEHLYPNAQHAREWLDGEADWSPSEDWKDLVRE